MSVHNEIRVRYRGWHETQPTLRRTDTAESPGHCISCCRPVQRYFLGDPWWSLSPFCVSFLQLRNLVAANNHLSTMWHITSRPPAHQSASVYPTTGSRTPENCSTRVWTHVAAWHCPALIKPLNTFETIRISDSSSHGVCLRGMGPSSCERCQVGGRCTEVCFESVLKIMELKLWVSSQLLPCAYTLSNRRKVLKLFIFLTSWLAGLSTQTNLLKGQLACPLSQSTR